MKYLVFLSLIIFSGCTICAPRTFHVEDRSIMSSKRLELTRDYARIHYGRDSYEMECPRMIVIHYTAFPTAEESFDFMKPDELSPVRDDIRAGGSVNVGSHYLVDRCGRIYALLPEKVIARHIVGFNHVAIGIENVGRGKDELTDCQIEADTWLIGKLVKRYPTIEYLIGHHEYMRKDLPHFLLFKEVGGAYKPTEKHDPGASFMERLRKRVRDEYGIQLKN
ncbi:MAG: peptidoglycan recognition family protein [Syntrophales bacterium]